MFPKNQLILSTASAAIAILLIQCAQSLDIESAKERPCFEVSKTVPTDLEWLMSVKSWHYNLGSRYDLYEFNADLANKDPTELTEDELYYRSCPTWHVNKNGTFVVKGYGNMEKSYKVKPLDRHFGSIEFSPLPGNLPGVAHTTLTDNKTFIFYVSCYTDTDQMAWSAVSPYKSLPEKTIKLVHEHAKSYGFKSEHFTGLRYDSCDEENEL